MHNGGGYAGDPAGSPAAGSETKIGGSVQVLYQLLYPSGPDFIYTNFSGSRGLDFIYTNYTNLHRLKQTT